MSFLPTEFLPDFIEDQNNFHGIKDVPDGDDLEKEFKKDKPKKDEEYNKDDHLVSIPDSQSASARSGKTASMRRIRRPVQHCSCLDLAEITNQGRISLLHPPAVLVLKLGLGHPTRAPSFLALWHSCWKQIQI